MEINENISWTKKTGSSVLLHSSAIVLVTNTTVIPPVTLYQSAVSSHQHARQNTYR